MLQKEILEYKVSLEKIARGSFYSQIFLLEQYCFISFDEVITDCLIEILETKKSDISLNLILKRVIVEYWRKKYTRDWPIYYKDISVEFIQQGLETEKEINPRDIRNFIIYQQHRFSETSEILINAMNCLSEREQFIIHMIYIQGWNQVKVGHYLGYTTNGRISQIVKSALLKLKRYLRRNNYPMEIAGYELRS